MYSLLTDPGPFVSLTAWFLRSALCACSKVGFLWVHHQSVLLIQWQIYLHSTCPPTSHLLRRVSLSLICRPHSQPWLSNCCIILSSLMASLTDPVGVPLTLCATRSLGKVQWGGRRNISILFNQPQIINAFYHSVVVMLRYKLQPSLRCSSLHVLCRGPRWFLMDFPTSPHSVEEFALSLERLLAHTHGNLKMQAMISRH